MKRNKSNKFLKINNLNHTSKRQYEITIQIKKDHIEAIHKEYMQVGGRDEGRGTCAIFGSKIYSSNIPLKKQTSEPISFMY